MDNAKTPAYPRSLKRLVLRVGLAVCVDGPKHGEAVDWKHPIMECVIPEPYDCSIIPTSPSCAAPKTFLYRCRAWITKDRSRHYIYVPADWSVEETNVRVREALGIQSENDKMRDAANG